MTIASAVLAIAVSVAPTPRSALAGGVVGSLTGKPTTVALPFKCEVSVRSDDNDKVTCPDATWSVDGRDVNGPLYGRVTNLTNDDGTLVEHVEARVFNGAAYLRPGAGTFGFIAAVAALVVFSVLTTAVSGLLAVVVNRRSRRWVTGSGAADQQQPEEQHSGFQSLLGLVILLAAAALVGAATTALAAESTNEMLAAAGVGLAVVVFTLFRVLKRLRER